MFRNTKDVFIILMQIEQNFARLYRNISVLDGKYSKKLETTAAVLAREEENHYEFYKKIIEDVSISHIFIEDDLYDRVYEILNDFKKSIERPIIKDEVGLIKFAIEYENRNANILREVIKVVEEMRLDDNKSLYKILEDLVKQEEKHSENLDLFIKNKN